MAQPVRNLNSADYKFGYNGKEKDDEIKGSGNSVDFGARMLDTRVGRWYATDRFEEKFPSVSTYSYADNSPIMKIDIGGDWPWIANQNMISGYMNSLGFLNKKFTLMDMNSFGHKHIHRQLSSFYQVWNDKNSGHYAPVIAKFLKEESIPVVIGKIKNDENGFINWGYTVGTEYIVLDKVIFKGLKEPNVESTFFHELIHKKGYGEFHAFSAEFSAGYIDENYIKSVFEDINYNYNDGYILDKTKKHEEFITNKIEYKKYFIEGGENLLKDILDFEEIGYPFKEGKSYKDIIKLMKETGDKIIK